MINAGRVYDEGSMADEHSFTDILGQSGWAVAVLTATWGIILRTLIGKHFKKWDSVEDRLRNIELDLFELKGRFREIDRRSGARNNWHGEERRRRDTWPGDP